MTSPTDPLPGGRPAERDALYNPAFIALILAQAATGHEARAGSGLPFSLAFLVAPMVLHGPTREELPRQARSKMALWLEEHPVQRAGLGRRAASLVPAVRAGIRYGLSTGALALNDVTLNAPKPRVKGEDSLLSAEVDDILARAGYVGGWFALAGSASGIYALWRVKP
jgi:Family of unknown function (DUF6521)